LWEWIFAYLTQIEGGIEEIILSTIFRERTEEFGKMTEREER